MPKYATLDGVNDPLLEVTEQDLLEADNYIDNVLRQKGIDPSAVSLPNETLKLLAVYYACYRSAIRNAQMEDTVLFEKAKHYKELFEEKAKQITPEVLGLEPPQTWWEIGTLGRG